MMRKLYNQMVLEKNQIKGDNLVQIGHNVHIGDHSVIVAQVGISGSTIIGRRCMIGGAVGIAGHLEIGDDVIVTGYSLVTHSLPLPGTYSSGMPAIAAADWRRAVARLHRLDPRKRKAAASTHALVANSAMTEKQAVFII